MLDEDSEAVGNLPNGFQLLQHGHKDIVGASAYNAYGNRLACSSADGRIKIYNRHADNSWHLCDTWEAHKAEILEIRWLPPTIQPHLLCTISLDGMFRIWVESPNVPPLSGRRFKSLNHSIVHQHRAPGRTPWHSFDVKHDPVSRNTYLALLASDGVLYVYENDEPENMSHWEGLDDFQVVTQLHKRQYGNKGRGTNAGTRGEIGLKVRFDSNPEPCWRVINAGMARDGLSLIVADMETARLWRTKETKHKESLGKSSTREFYNAGEFQTDSPYGVIRDIAWAGGNVRGYDRIAVAWSDGTVRIYKIFTPPPEPAERPMSDHNRSGSHSNTLAVDTAAHNNRPATSPARQPSSTVSGIGEQILAGERAINAGVRRRSLVAQIQDVITEEGTLAAHDGGAKKVAWDEDGSVLMTAGDDGSVKMWRMRPTGEWSNSATLAMTGPFADN